ncbi:MAG: imidazolonepropionase [Acidimicrobiales bacterium]|jgi:imidazolonepropionase
MRPLVGSLLVRGIGVLVTNKPELGSGPLGVMRDVDLVVEDGTVVWIGSAGSPPAADEVLEAAGRCVVPGFVDSHTHLVFAGDRSEEFTARMAGTRYNAGGIAATVAATRSAPSSLLTETAARLKREAETQGTTTLETKSGYGLTVYDESRCLEVAGTVAEEVTYLGAHVVAPEFRGRDEDYVALVTGAMLDACAPKARWCDVFCEKGAFGPEAAREILQAGLDRGLGLRVHANQLSHGAGVQLAVEMGAASADHCTHLDGADVDALAGSDTVATLLPGAEFSTRSPYPDARRLLDSGVTVALATDCNPGTSYTTSMPFVIALAVREMHMTPDEALFAATAGGARALRRDDLGVLAPGFRGDLVVLDAPSAAHLAYRPGVNLVAAVVRAGLLLG